MLRSLFERISSLDLGSLISDNGLQFDSKAFRRYCCDLEITNGYSTSAYPQGTGQAEAVDKVIVNGLKRDWMMFK